jgi:hypothetical protein
MFTVYVHTCETNIKTIAFRTGSTYTGIHKKITSIFKVTKISLKSTHLKKNCRDLFLQKPKVISLILAVELFVF